MFSVHNVWCRDSQDFGRAEAVVDNLLCGRQGRWNGSNVWKGLNFGLALRNMDVMFGEEFWLHIGWKSPDAIFARLYWE